MTIPELPQDIIGAIVQAFAEMVLPDKEQLKKLCLISHAFVSQSQRYLFHTVSLMRSGHRDRDPPYHPTGEQIHILGRRLHGLLKTSPHLFRYIRILKTYAWSSAKLAWVTSMGEEAAAIIRTCPVLQALELGSEAPIKWRAIHPSLQSSLTSCIQSPQLVRLTFFNVRDIPRSLLSSFGSLRALSLESVSFDIQARQNLAESRQIELDRPLIEHLCIADSSPCIRLLLDEPTLLSSQLITLDIKYEYNTQDPSLMHDLLDRVYAIQELHIILSENVVDRFKSIPIHPLQNLRHISIFTGPNDLRITYPSIKHVITTSTTLQSANVISPIVSAQWWNWDCLDALHLWADFYPDPPFEQLTLSFILPEDNII